MNLPSQRPIKSLTAEQRPVILKGPLFQGGRLVLKNGLPPPTPPKPQNHWASPKTPNLGVVVKELDRYLVNVLHDDDLLALIAIPPLIVERRVVTLGYQHLAGKVDLADSWSAQNPDSAHICLVDEFEILAVNALQIAQVLNLNFGGISMNLPSQRPIKSLTAEQRPCNTEGAAVPGRKTGSKKRPPSPYPLPNPKTIGLRPKPQILGWW